MGVWVGGGGGMGSLRSEALFQCAGLRVMESCSKLISRLSSWITYPPFSTPKAHTIFFFRWNWSWLTVRRVEPIIGYNKKRCGFFKTTTRVHVFIAQYNLQGLCPSAICYPQFLKAKTCLRIYWFQNVMVQLRLYYRQWNYCPVVCF